MTDAAPPKAIIRNLATLCYAQGFTLWLYKMGAESFNGHGVLSAGFFDDFADMWAVGDMVLVTGAAESGVLRVDRKAVNGVRFSVVVERMI